MIQKESNNNSNPPEIQTLVNLGLTLVQARVYLALVRFGPLKTTSVSKVSKVARPDVYRTLSTLYELSLVEQIIGNPLQYKATPIENGVNLLLKNKTEQYEKLKRDCQVLLSQFDEKEDLKTTQSADNLFILIPKKETVIQEQIQAIQEAQKSIDIVASWNRYYHGKDIFDQRIKEAAEKEVNIRYIVEDPPLKELRNHTLIGYTGNFFEMRFVVNKPGAIFGIYDRKKAMVVVDPLFDLPGASPSLWTNNLSLISLIQTQFENLWKIAKHNATN